MSNALVKTDTRTALATTAYDPFASAGEEMGGSSATYLKFNGTSGEYSFGTDGEELEDGHKLVADMNSFRRGWICWVDSAVKDEKMVRVIDGRPPEMSDLPDYGPYVKDEERNDGWAEQAAVNFRDPETGKEFVFKVSSKSGLRSLGTLLKDYGKDYKNHPGELPVIELGSQSFIPKVKKYGKKYSPILKIVDWVSEADLMAKFGDNAADYADQTEGEPEGEEGDAPEQEAAPVAPAPKPTAATVNPPAAAPGAPRRRSF